MVRQRDRRQGIKDGKRETKTDEGEERKVPLSVMSS